MNDTHESRDDVVRLLSFLASALEEANSAERDVSSSRQRVRRTVGRRSRIRRLRRVFNIILFGSASHEEAIEQAATEDRYYDNRGFADANTLLHNDEVASSFAEERPEQAQDTHQLQRDEDDGMDNLQRLVSTASLQLRRARRYDSANAFDGLVDGLLLVRHGHDTGSIARMLRLLMALQNIQNTDTSTEHSGQNRDVDIIGAQGRQVLRGLYGVGAQPGAAQLLARTDMAKVNVLPLPHEQQHQHQHERQHEQQKFQGDTPSWRDARNHRHGETPGDVGSTEHPTAMSLGVPRAKRYLLPTDCILHGDSIATDPYSGGRGPTVGFAIDRIPWFTDSEFSSERSIPNIHQDPSLDRCMAEMIRAPLSPTAWTKHEQPAAAGGKVAPSFRTGGTGGSPAASAALNYDYDERVGGGGGGRGGTTTCAGSSSQSGGDLCGAIHRCSSMDPRSSATRELRITLSFPDLDDSPKDLLEAAQVQQAIATTKHEMGRNGYPNHDAGLGSHSQHDWRRVVQAETRCCPRDDGAGQQEQQSVSGYPTRRRKCTLHAKDDLASFHHDLIICGSSSGANPIKEGATLHLHPIGWQRAEACWNSRTVADWALAPAPLLTREGDRDSRAFELCFREHFGGVDGDTQPPSFTESEMLRRALAALQGVPSEMFWYDCKQARMQVSRRWRNRSTPRGRAGENSMAAAGLVRRKCQGSPVRLTGLSPGSVLSFLEEFALAGTYYRRVEEFAAFFLDTSVRAGQVAQAFGAELRQQLTRLQAMILVVVAGVTADNAADARENNRKDVGDIAARPRQFGTVEADGSTCSAGSLSLAGILHRTTGIRRAVEALADICGLASDSLGIDGGVRMAAAAFPRGASLLTYVYKIAEARRASEPGESLPGGNDGVPGKLEYALTLLSSAALPYLAMLGQWLWSGEMRKEDDPYEEFPVRCRESPTVASVNGDGCQSWVVKEPWMRDGGGSFMTEAFRESITVNVPCFLDGGVLAAATRAGKVLRLLKLSSPEFFESCAASPPPPLSLVFDSHELKSREIMFSRLSLLRATGALSAARAVRVRAAELELKKVAERMSDVGALVKDERSALRMLESQREKDHASATQARRIWVQGLEEDRKAAAAASSPAKDSSPLPEGRGPSILSFLEPPTSMAEEKAAVILREKYFLLGEEADARAARARWKRQRSERFRSARSSLRDLYTAEARSWKAESMAMARGVTAMTVPTKAVAVADEVSCEGGVCAVSEASLDETSATNTEPAAADVVPEDSNDKDREGGEQDSIDGRPCVDVESPGESREDSPVALDSTIAAQRTHAASNHCPISMEPADDQDVQAPGIHSATLKRESHPTGEVAHEERGDGDDGSRVKFSHVTIIQEPGGKSTGVARALSDGCGVGKDPGSEEGANAAGERRDGVDRVGVGDDDGYLSRKFSHVTIVQEPGGNSSGVSQALGGPQEATGGGDGGESGDGGKREAPRDPESHSSRVAHSTTPNFHAVSCDTETGTENVVDDGIIAGADGEDRPRLSDDAPIKASVSGESSPAILSQDAFIASEASILARGMSPTRERVFKPLAPSDTIDESMVRGGGGEDIVGSRRGELSIRSARHPHDQLLKEFGLPDTGRGLSASAAATGARGAQGEDNKDKHPSPLPPLEIIVRRCLRDPILAQCQAVDSAALTFLVGGAGALELLTSIRTFLLGLHSGFLHDFTLRLLEGLYDGGVDWRRSSNLNTAFIASATTTGLESAPLFDTFRYEVDLTHGGMFSGAGVPVKSSTSSSTMTQTHEGGGGIEVALAQELYSPSALSYVNPVLSVAWPLGVLLPTGALHAYGVMHRALFRHHVALHRLRRLRLTLRELDIAMDAMRRGRGSARGQGGVGNDRDRRVSAVAGSSWDSGRLHWVHMFRHEMQHMADTLQSFFAEQAEVGWPELRQSLASASSPFLSDWQSGSAAVPVSVPRVGGLAVLTSAHARYIQDMRCNLFLGSERPCMVARARIEDLYEVVCTVGRVADSLGYRQQQQQQQIPSDDLGPAGAAGVGNVRNQYVEQTMVVPDDAFSELVSAREKFDAVRKGLCDALVDITANVRGARTRPLLAVLGYGGYGEG